MGILDEAIREHLELKRKHGAEQGELRKIEDEAFGPPARPEAVEPPDSESPEPVDASAGGIDTGEDPTMILGGAEGTEIIDAPAEAEVDPADETLPEDPEAIDREAIAQQPTEIFDVEGELAREAREADERSQEAEPAAAESSEEVAEHRIEAPEALEVEPEATPIEEESAELDASAPDVAEPEPASEEPVAETEAATEREPTAEEPAAETEAPPEPVEIFDEETLSDELDQALDLPGDAEQRRAAFFEETDEFRAPTQRPSRQTGDTGEFQEGPEEDVLEETPDFLEETPEHDRLWFEQKPPKDFDFND